MKIKLIGFPMKEGCHVDGCDMGINAINDNCKLDEIININVLDKDLDTVVKYDTELAKIVDETIKNNIIPITVGGDHSLAIGSIAGSAKNYDDLGVIWLDTHPDINTDKTTTTFHIHGYPLAASMGFGQDELTKLYFDKTKVKYENVVLFGINDIDEPEQELINKYNIKNFTLDDINTKGIDTCLKEAIEYLNFKTKNIHLSFDIDSISTKECPGVNIPNKWNNGITYKEAQEAIKEFTSKLNIVSMDIVEYNPLTDSNNKSLNIVLDTINYIKENLQK